MERSIADRAGEDRGLGEVLDEHAELRDLQVQLAEAADLGILSGLLLRLRDLLQAHFAREEADPAVRQVLDDGFGPAVGDVSGLLAEHRVMLSSLDELISRIEADEHGSLEAFEREVAALLERIQRHDARETELFGANVAAGRPGPPLPGSGSKALEVNLRRTAVDVVIPPEHALLLEITADRYGVQENTRKLLREINHRYVGWPQTLEELHRRAMSDLDCYLTSERAAEAIGVFLSLYAKVAEQGQPASVRETAVRQWFYYIEKLVSESRDVVGLALVMKRALARLDVIFGREPRYAVISSPRLRHFAEKLLASQLEDPSGELAEHALAQLTSSLRRVYEHWLAQADPADWFHQYAGDAEAPRLPEPVASISRARLAQHLERVDRLGSGPGPLREHAREILELPDNAQIERSYLDAAECVDSETNEPWQNRLARIRWLIRILSSEPLAPVHEQAVAEIHHAYRDAIAGADPSVVEQLLRETFAGLRRSSLSSSSGALSLISKIGVAVFAGADPGLAKVVGEEMLDWDFPGPGFAGFSDEWQVRVDPAHLRAIRAFLAVIESDPELARPLIAGLVVHLKLGGVFVADTDLFQKDVSGLLNSGIGRVYHPVKHLLKLFPVYFNDIGAEGEMRDVSSRIDEIGSRKDPLIHFLRKQCHVESNPRLVQFVDAIGDFWASGDREPLRSYVPSSLYDRLDVADEAHRARRRTFSRLLADRDLAALAELDDPGLEGRLAEIPEVPPLEAEKARLLIRLRKLLSEKYELGRADLLDRLSGDSRIDEGDVAALRRALAAGHHEDALDVLLRLLEQLKQIITSEERTEGFENIYRKRHIAVGIPSVYGSYREEKFEALGLSLRIEAAASALFEQLISQASPECVTRATLSRTARWLRLLLRAVRVDGCQGRGLDRGISMLDQALRTESISVDQFINIVQIISRSVEQLIRIRFIDVYQEVLERIVGRSLQAEAPAGGTPIEAQEEILKASEALLRALIAEGFGLQPLDRLIGKLLQALNQTRQRFDRETLGLLVSFDAARCFVPLDAPETPLDGPVTLGNKGSLIRRLARDGLPVPPGFILTTELFRCWPAIRGCDELRAELRERALAEVARLEERTGFRFGDSRRPLLLSVRSGAVVSMPGILDTFLNVGINEQIAEGLAVRSGSRWGAWDAYRRFLQFWGMGHGIPRDRFDDLMRWTKAEFGATRKAEIPGDAMRDVADRYRRFVEEQGVGISDDPTEQLERCVELVLRSWNSSKARIYRAELQIAEEWGTAVIVQSMVYGNLNERSGTGVVVTSDSRRSSGDVSLSGDFVVQSQGDDVVSGLVETLPISEEQPHAGGRSLERDFPRIHRALLDHARSLIRDRGMFHQELEFTFESDDPADLYILQTRDRVMAAVSSVSAFVPGLALERARLASGIGAGGGALSGRIAHTAEDLDSLRNSFGDAPLILLRPDTVPDDIPLILRADGVVTSLGGATSHAALVAQQLGRTCVVGCRGLQVDEERGCSQLGDHTLRTGEMISISGIDGTVYLGKHPTRMVRRRSLV